jgi:ribosome biogenesis GTPase / thiamine phosphate phosphatase
VGKSTILNRLMGSDLQAVEEVRKCDSRGRHTTTARQIFSLPGGALLMDTPGLRALQLWDADDGISQAFSDIGERSAHCRFGNCTHRAEPGCAVEEAIAAGTLDRKRLENWRKLQRELEFQRRKVDPEAGREEKQRIKQLMRRARKIYRESKKR